MSKSAFVLGIISQKGGPGKTSVGVNLASAAAEQGLASVIIDLDQQANAANWKDRRDKLGKTGFENPAVTFAPPGRLRQTLEIAEQNGADFVVIDCPGKADNIAIVAAAYADLVLVPMEPRMSNLETIPGVHSLLQAVDAKLRKERGFTNPTPPAFLVLNKLHPSATTQADKLKQLITKAYPQIPVCPHHLIQLDIYGTSQDIGKSVFDEDTEGRAAQDIRQLYKFTISQPH